MDIENILKKIVKAFQENNVHYALMGGYALGLWGVGRTTVDIDFMVIREDLKKVNTIMSGLGYECMHRSENVSQYVSQLKVFGEVDFLHAFRRYSREMINKAEEREIFGGSLKVKTVKPEDLIGLKLQAISNDPERKELDMEDIKSLIKLQRERLDWSLIEEYFKLFNMEPVLRNLKDEKDEAD